MSSTAFWGPSGTAKLMKAKPLFRMTLFTGPHFPNSARSSLSVMSLGRLPTYSFCSPRLERGSLTCDFTGEEERVCECDCGCDCEEEDDDDDDDGAEAASEEEEEGDEDDESLDDIFFFPLA